MSDEKIQRYHTEQFAKYLKRLAETRYGEGSLLDHSMILYGSNMSNSNAHDHYPLPNIVVGGARRRLKGGQHIVAEAQPENLDAVANLGVDGVARFHGFPLVALESG